MVAGVQVVAADDGHAREVRSNVRVSIERALREIPFYVKRGARLATEGSLAKALASLPLLHKKDIRATLPKQWVPAGRDLKADLASGAIEIVETAGSTGERARVLHDAGWWARQEARALRTNAVVARALGSEVGASPRLAVLAMPATGTRSCNAGDLAYEERLTGSVLALSQRPDPTYWKPAEMARMIAELSRHATVGLIADPMHLAVLARYAARQGQTLDVRGFIALTHATTTAAALRAIKAVSSVPVLQVYSAREVGTLFVQGEDGRLYHAPFDAPFTTHVELLPVKVATPGAANVALVVVTTLDREAQPLVRYVVGDLVQVERDAPRGPSDVAALVSLEGRVDDAIVRGDGALVTAGALDRALADVDGVALFQANQRTPEQVDVDVVCDDSGGSIDAERVVRDVRAALTVLLAGLAVDVRTVSALAAEASGKVRIARRAFPLDYAATFEIGEVGL